MKLRDAAVIDVFLATMSWAGVGFVLDRVAPTMGARMALLALLFLALGSLLLPLTAAVHAVVRRRLEEERLGVWLRQAMLASLYAVVCLWLQMLRALSVFNALLLAGVLVLLEVMLLDRGGAESREEALPD